MPIANYTTTIAPEKTAAEIQGMLSKAGASRIMTSMDEVMFPWMLTGGGPEGAHQRYANQQKAIES